MTFENLKITLTNGENNFFSFTDRLNSYLMLHNTDEKKSDGFIRENEVLFKDFYILFNKKKFNRFKADKTEILADTCIFYFYALNLQVEIIVPPQKGTLLFKVVNNNSSANKVVFCFFNNEKTTEKTLEIGINLFSLNDSFSSSEIESEIKKSNEYYKNLIQHFDFNTGLENVDKALIWAQLSGNKLCTGEKDARGIWAGLPWFRDNWGRDTFIAITGILIVNGLFPEAKSIIHAFAKYQDKDSSSKTYGRIPNRYRNNEDVLYNTCDGNLWFVNAMWQYVQYSGDKAFLNEVWETVKLCILSDIERRTDENGFLLHDDADTWMDARIKGNQPLSPRGNRANDIEILWYNSLCIYIKIAEILGVNDGIEKVANVKELLEKNFAEFYWNESENKIADRIKTDGTKDFKVRPNQLFCVMFDNMLLKEDVLYKITKTSFEKLCLPYGVISLESTDIDFHPYHDNCKKYHKDAAYHNGAIWLWNCGPMVTALCRFGFQDIAFEMTKNLCNQINKTACVGTLSENADALLNKKGEFVPSGTWSQAWSVSEFSRNFYQDYLGLKIELLNNRLIFNPKIPEEWKEGSTKVYFGKNRLTISWSDKTDDNTRSFKFSDLEAVEAENENSSYIDLFILDGVTKVKKELCKGKDVEVKVKIQKSNERLDFLKIDPKQKFMSLQKKNYLFNKILKSGD